MPSFDAAADDLEGGRSRRAACVAGFAGLLTLAVLWPGPVRWLNDATLGLPLRVHERSFLGRQAPEWDVVYWCVAGLCTIAMLHGRIGILRAAWAECVAMLWRMPSRFVRRIATLPRGGVAIALVAALGVLLFVSIRLDGPMIAGAVDHLDGTARVFVRVFNRLGGGMNPPMTVVFVVLCGLTWPSSRWMARGVAMAEASLISGIIVTIVKHLTDRSRPETWLGPVHFEQGISSSFPSGHTVGVFAIAGVLMAGRAGRPVQLIGLFVACAVAVARVLSYRHWPSDVVASAILGLASGWFCMSAIERERVKSEE